MTIELNLTKIIGTGKTKVPVKHKTGTTYEYRRTGRKPPRAGTGRIDKLPQNIRNEILELRTHGQSGSQIKEQIETMLEIADPTTRQKLIDANIISSIGSKLNVTPQALTDYAKKRGVSAPKERKTVAQVKKEVDAKWKDEWDKVNTKNSKLEIEIQEIHDKLEANKIDAKNKEKIRDKLRTDLTACQAKLGGK